MENNVVYSAGNIPIIENAEREINELIGRLNDHKPTNQETLREHAIRIEFQSSGCVVFVGCKSVAFSNNIDAINAIMDYVNNPIIKKQEWENKFNNL